MPSFIVKPTRDRDFYVYWSTVVDDVIACGSRAELTEYLTKFEHPSAAGPKQFDRADQTGTSSRRGVSGRFGWDDDEFRLGQFEEIRAVKRADLEAYANARCASDDPADAIGHTYVLDDDDDETASLTTSLTIPGDPKTIREALCVAEGATLWNVDERNLYGAREVLGALIQECDRHRPLGPNGKHGDRHTATCGCYDVPERYRVAAPLHPRALDVDELARVDAETTRCSWSIPQDGHPYSGSCLRKLNRIDGQVSHGVCWDASYARATAIHAALAAALTDQDATRDPAVDDLAPGSLARRLWATALTDGDGGLTVRDARTLATAVRAHLLGGTA